MALYLPVTIQQAAAYVKGRWIGSSGSFNPVAHGWNSPQLLLFPSDLMRPGDNELHLFLAGYVASDNLMGPVYLGPQSELQPAFESLNFLRVELVAASTHVMMFLAIFMGVLWLFRSKDSAYGWLALGCLAFWIWNQNLIVTELPLPFQSWHALVMTSQGLTVVFVTMSCYRLLNSGRRALEWWVAGFCLFGSAPMFLRPPEALLVYSFMVWNLLCFSIGLYAFVRLLWAGVNRRIALSYQVLLFPMLIALAFALRDMLGLAGVTERNTPLLFQFGVLAIVVVHSFFLIQRFVTALRDSENANLLLEERLQEQQLKLESNYEKLRLMERDRLLTEERGRIMRDMHDGVGGQLVATLSLLNTGDNNTEELRERLRESIGELKLMIQSLDPKVSTLEGMLRTLDKSIERPLEACGVQYSRNELAPRCAGVELEPGTMLQVLRILQECATNCIKHSGASVFRVDVEGTDDGLRILISDNGGGLETKNPVGKGLDNMARRAASIGGRLNISSDHGLRVELTLPLGSAEPK